MSPKQNLRVAVIKSCDKYENNSDHKLAFTRALATEEEGNWGLEFKWHLDKYMIQGEGEDLELLQSRGSLIQMPPRQNRVDKKPLQNEEKNIIKHA